MKYLRRYALSLVIVLVTITLGLTAKALIAIQDTNARLQKTVNSQVTNRAANVNTWCKAINQGRDYNRKFVHDVTHGHTQYKLADLSCPTLVAATLKSAHHK